MMLDLLILSHIILIGLKLAGVIKCSWLKVIFLPLLSIFVWFILNVIIGAGAFGVLALLEFLDIADF